MSESARSIRYANRAASTTSKGTTKPDGSSEQDKVTEDEAMKAASISTSQQLSPRSKSYIKLQNQLMITKAFDELMELRADNFGRKVHGDIQGIVKRFQSKGFQVERHHLEYKMKLYIKGLEIKNPPENAPVQEIAVNGGSSTISPITQTGLTEVMETTLVEVNTNEENVSVGISVGENEEINDSENNLPTKKVGGRPKGSTKKTKRAFTENEQKALKMASDMLLEAKVQAEANGKKCAKGTLKNIIAYVEELHLLPQGTINPDTVYTRVKSGNHEGIHSQRISPVDPVEPLLVDWICRMSRMGEAFSKYEIMDLADEIIRYTEYAEDLIEFCDKRGITKDMENSEERLLGNRWYVNFLKRHDEELKRGKCRIQDNKRRTWCTIENFLNMYECIYESMVECGVAVKLDEEKMFDKNGNITEDPEEMYGRPSRYHLIHPERCLFVDETGCNTNQKDDGHQGGKLYVLDKNQTEGARVGSFSDLHFTVMPFIAGTGEPVLCAIIVKSEKKIEDLSVLMHLGIDYTKEVKTGKTRVETVLLNRETGASIGGPRCRFNGKILPCFVGCSPNASITSEMLVEMLKVIDKSGVFPRSPELGIPFLLLDGHNSRTRLPFLNYINDDNHKWKCCIGVPYATHLWQPADSSEVNGSFKIKLSKAKAAYLKQKPRDKKRFVNTDVIPIVNHTWPFTLARQEYNKKAISERGWGPLTYVLLDDDRLIKMDKEYKESMVKEKEVYQVDINKINKTGETFTNTLDLLMDERDLCEGRKRRYEERKAYHKSKKEKIDVLNSMVGMTSGKLVVENFYCLTDDDVVAKARNDDDVKKKHEEARELRTAALKSKDDSRFKGAIRKYWAKQKLLKDDYNILLKRTQMKGDSPIKSRLGDLEKQFANRKHRMAQFDYHDNTTGITDGIDAGIDAGISAGINTSIDMKEVAQSNADGNDDDCEDFMNFVSVVNNSASV
jgi:hypothetical protein